MTLLWYLIAFLIKEFSMTRLQGDIMVRKHEALTVSAIECSSHTDITINFIDLSNITTLIADCDTQGRSCHVFDTFLGKFYAVSYTGEGAFLYIKNIANTLGKYTCCETYNKTKCVSTELISIAANDFNRSSNQIDYKQMLNFFETYQRDMNERKSQLESHRMLLALIVFILMLLSIGIFCPRNCLKGLLLRWFPRWIHTKHSNVHTNLDDKNDAESAPNEDNLRFEDAHRESMMLTELTPMNHMDSGFGSSGNSEIDGPPASRIGFQDRHRIGILYSEIDEPPASRIGFQDRHRIGM